MFKYTVLLNDARMKKLNERVRDKVLLYFYLHRNNTLL